MGTIQLDFKNGHPWRHLCFSILQYWNQQVSHKFGKRLVPPSSSNLQFSPLKIPIEMRDGWLLWWLSESVQNQLLPQSSGDSGTQETIPGGNHQIQPRKRLKKWLQNATKNPIQDSQTSWKIYGNMAVSSAWYPLGVPPMGQSSLGLMIPLVTSGAKPVFSQSGNLSADSFTTTWRMQWAFHGKNLNEIDGICHDSIYNYVWFIWVDMSYCTLQYIILYTFHHITSHLISLHYITGQNKI